MKKTENSNNPSFQVLLSCKNGDTKKIIRSSNLNEVNTIIINQREVKKEQHNKIDSLHTEIITPTKGLSVSRNIAIKKTVSDVCLLSDDDEKFVDGLANIVLENYQKNKKADIIIFSMKNRDKSLGHKAKKVSFFDTLKISSWQISFRPEIIKKYKIRFDEMLGAGTNNGAGEENKFLLDCYRKKLNIYYTPVEIATVAQEQSTWFHGYNKKYFYDRGKVTRYIYGFSFSMFYAFYFALFKKSLFKNQLPARKALRYMIDGIIKNELKS